MYTYIFCNAIYSDKPILIQLWQCEDCMYDLFFVFVQTYNLLPPTLVCYYHHIHPLNQVLVNNAQKHVQHERHLYKCKQGNNEWKPRFGCAK